MFQYHPKNPDPSYGNTRPSDCDTPGTSKTGVNLTPRPPDFSNHRCLGQEYTNILSNSPKSVLWKTQKTTKSKIFYRVLQGFGNLQQIKISFHLISHMKFPSTPLMDVFARFLFPHLQLPVSSSSTGPRLCGRWILRRATNPPTHRIHGTNGIFTYPLS